MKVKRCLPLIWCKSIYLLRFLNFWFRLWNFKLSFLFFFLSNYLLLKVQIQTYVQFFSDETHQIMILKPLKVIHIFFPPCHINLKKFRLSKRSEKSSILFEIPEFVSFWIKANRDLLVCSCKPFPIIFLFANAILPH